MQRRASRGCFAGGEESLLVGVGLGVPPGECERELGEGPVGVWVAAPGEALELLEARGGV